MTARARPALLAPWLALLVALAIVLAPAAARAQDYATLIADLVRVEGSSRLVAEGNVEVLHRGNRLQAAQVIYDRDADLLSIVGPIVLSDARGTVILADAAELSPDLRDGLLTSARMVLEQQLQLAANSIARASGRFTTLSRVVASSCQVCAANPVPLWEIRARRVVH
ncbi:MAG: LPS-assembly protein LptD, partial [Rhodobacteraceae bacterium]|nr:LPS-assembly protein LptD [Paracoccaceae bacterium]